MLNEPFVSWNSEQDSFYTLIMTDPCNFFSLVLALIIQNKTFVINSEFSRCKRISTLVSCKHTWF